MNPIVDDRPRNALPGTTYDGHEVPSNLKLKWTWWSAEKLGWGGVVVLVCVHMQTCDGKRRPFLSMEVGPWLVQIGWLFG